MRPLLLALFSLFAAIASAQIAPGVTVSYELPSTGPLPQTYRVTLAIVDAKRPDWIISQFAAGVVRTVTAENGGKFTETWNGLDDNFMPVPPGTYATKGIYMPAAKWAVDGEFHSITPRYITSADAWRARPGEANPPIVVGDPVNSPLGDVDVGANGVGVFCYQYLENARNFYTADFNQPISYDQASAGFPSGGAAGGKSVATDGVSAWCSENEGFVFRTDGKKFGNKNARYRKNVHLQEGFVTALAAWRNPTSGKSFVYLAERGRLIRDEKKWYHPAESTTDRVNQIIVLDGETANSLATVSVKEPLGVVARWGDRLWVLHKVGDSFAVSAANLKEGIPDTELKIMFKLPGNTIPSDLEVDSHGRVYIAYAQTNHVLQFSASGDLLRTFGKLAVQRSGSYDRESFMSPEKLACWRDAQGQDHLIVVERHGFDRVSEWNADDGKLSREWLSAQTFANAGYAIDPKHPDQLYMQGHGGWLLRFRVNYQTGEWRAEAVWPDVCTGRFADGHFGFPRILYHGDTRYLAWARGAFIYRESGDRWLASAAILTEGRGKDRKRYLWHDENGDGQVQESEYEKQLITSAPNPRYWGDSWLDDLSLVAIQEGAADVWRLAPASFDKHGNPVFSPDGWKKLLTDPVLEARKLGTATGTFGGNEIGDRFSSAWAMVAGSIKDGFYVNARGPDISANFGAQQKLSRYSPDGKGGYALTWRVGRTALNGTANEGEVYGSIHVMAPMGGLITQIDQSRMGVVLYTEDGLYVDTLFPDERKTGGKTMGPYNLPGEFFTGYSYVNQDDGKVYLALGKTSPMIFEATGWTAQGNPTRRLEKISSSVSISAAQIAAAPEFALAVRKQRSGSTSARVALFAPMPGGGPALDGSLSGWEICEPVTFAADAKQSAEVRCGFDREHLFLRWHVRLGRKFAPKPLEPVERIFTHDREADTFSFYIQGDPLAAPAKNANGRAGDSRFVFGLFKDKETVRPVALAMLPQWSGNSKPSPLTYKTPAGGAAVFEHVGLLTSAKLGHVMDTDGEGYVIAAAIPLNSIPMLPALTGQFRTLVNFDATFGGHNRIWWANADGSATRETYDEPTEARLYPGSWSQANFAPMSGLPIRAWSAIGPFGFARLAQLRHREDRPEITRTLGAIAFPPEQGIDFGATFTGEITQTRKGLHKLAWKPASVSGDIVSFETALGWKGYEEEGTAYLVTWVQSPQPTTIKLSVLDAHGHHAVRAWINDHALPAVHPKGQGPKDLHYMLDATQPVTLKAGWNKLLIRFDQVWGGNQVGLTVDAAPEVLWSLKFSPTPPIK